jgi:hypothetical protein
VKGKQLSGAILIPPYALGPDFFRVPGEPPLHIFQVMPVTPAEMSAKLTLGVDGLLEAMEKKAEGALGPYGPIQHDRRSLL